MGRRIVVTRADSEAEGNASLATMESAANEGSDIGAMTEENTRERSHAQGAEGDASDFIKIPIQWPEYVT
jgi:hypothetical protein